MKTKKRWDLFLKGILDHQKIEYKELYWSEEDSFIKVILNDPLIEDDNEFKERARIAIEHIVGWMIWYGDILVSVERESDNRFSRGIFKRTVYTTFKGCDIYNFSKEKTELNRCLRHSESFSPSQRMLGNDCSPY